MPSTKNTSGIVFYIFIILFIITAYLYKNGVIASLFPQKATVNKVVEIEYQGKELKVDYPKKYNKLALELSGFEEGEKWKGEFKISDANYWEGSSSYVIFSRNGQPVNLSLQKNIDLSDYSIFNILVYSEEQENSNNIKKLAFRLGDRNDNEYYEYDILNVKSGWNIIRMSKNNFTLINGSTPIKKDGEDSLVNKNLWERIEKISLVINSRPNSQVELKLDRLWTEKDNDYKKDFLVGNDDMLSIRVFDGKTYVNLWNLGGNLTLIKKVTGVRNFTYTAKIIPQKTGAFGISTRTDINTGYGYYLNLGGIGTGTWQLYKIGKPVNNNALNELDSGSIANFQIEANQPVWLRFTTSDDTISGYFSTDGNAFTKLTEKNDNEHRSGGIGITTSSSSFLLESIEFKQ